MSFKHSLISCLVASVIEAKTATVELLYADPARPNRTMRIKFCKPSEVGQFPLFLYGHGAGCAPDDYDYFCSVAATGMIYQPWGSLFPDGDFPDDFDTADQALDQALLTTLLQEQAATNESSPLYGSLDGTVILGGHSMGGGMTVLATGMDGANEHASGLALFAPGVYVTTPSGEPYLGNITIPVLLVSGAVDCGMNALEKQAQRAFDAFASERKFLVVPKGANHCQWTDPTKDPAHGICKSLVETECHGIEIGVQHDLANRLVRTFTAALHAGTDEGWSSFEADLAAGEAAGTWQYFSSVTSDPGKTLHNDCGTVLCPTTTTTTTTAVVEAII